MLRPLYNNPAILLFLLQLICPLSSCIGLWRSHENKPRTYNSAKHVVEHVKLYVTTEQAVNVVNERFVSVAIDSNEIKKQWNHGKLNFSSPKLQTLSAALDPSYLRLGGTNADFLIYSDERLKNTSKKKYNKTKIFTNYTMLSADWDDVNQFCNAVGWQIIFDVNVLLRNGSQWDDDNFRKILAYNSRQGYKVHWELGNEPNQFGNGKVTNISISGEQLALDYRHLRSLLDSSVEYRHNFIMGPSVTHPKVKKGFSEPSLTFMTEFYDGGGGDVINATTWHQYYVDGTIATEDNFTDPDVLDSLIPMIKSMKEVVYRYKPGSKIWLGETSSAYGGGAEGLSNSYISGFMWLDKLGVAALHGIDVVIRQSLYGGRYSLLTEDLDPLPDWWLSLLYKRLVGQKVLKVTTSGRGNNANLKLLRSYVHCTLASSEYTHGDVTVYLLNLDKSSVKSVSISQFDELTRIDQYLLTSYGKAGLKSKGVKLNNMKLKMIDEKNLPSLQPKRLNPKNEIVLPPLSFGFYVMKGAKAAACL